MIFYADDENRNKCKSNNRAEKIIVFLSNVKLLVTVKMAYEIFVSLWLGKKKLYVGCKTVKLHSAKGYTVNTKHVELFICDRYDIIECVIHYNNPQYSEMSVARLQGFYVQTHCLVFKFQIIRWFNRRRLIDD